jgi:hypothetical protein
MVYSHLVSSPMARLMNMWLYYRLTRRAKYLWMTLLSSSGTSLVAIDSAIMYVYCRPFIHLRQLTNAPPFHLPLSSLFQIGEVALMKEMTSMASAVMTEEEKADIEREMNNNRSGTASPASTPGITEHARPASPPAASASAPAAAGVSTSASEPASSTPTPSKSTDAATTPSSSSPALSNGNGKEKEKEAKAKRKITPEQREKLDALDKERAEKMKIRVEELSVKLIERLRPFVDGNQDAEFKTWEAKIRTEAEDLKLESFGVEVRFPCFFWLFIHN